MLEVLPVELALHFSVQLIASNNPLKLELPPLHPGGAAPLFCDPDFPADERALFHNPSSLPDSHLPIPCVQWLRPHEVCTQAGEEAPQLFVDSATSSDVVQGALGDCWLLSALAVVALHREGLIAQIFTPSAAEGLPPGSLTVQFWMDGRWQRVTIDDRLPCDVNGRLLYAHSIQPNEMWVPLLEKAFAKVCGSYESLASGFVDR